MRTGWEKKILPLLSTTTPNSKSSGEETPKSLKVPTLKKKKLYAVLSRSGKNKEVAKGPFASAIYLFYIMNIKEKWH